MILLIDIGNQRIKYGFLLETGFHFLGACHHKNETKIEGILTQAFSSVPRPQKVFVASVASIELTKVVLAWVYHRWHVKPMTFTVQADESELSVAYPNPERFGIDRWLALLGALQVQREYALVVDCGTCVSFDAVAKSGAHQGGLILPGLQLMRTSIIEGTARCYSESQGDSADMPSLLGNNTQDGIERGTLFALLATIAQLKHELSQEFKEEFTVFLTGGDAPLLLPFLEIPVLYRPHLIFEGMAALIRKNKYPKTDNENTSSLLFELNADYG